MRCTIYSIHLTLYTVSTATLQYRVYGTHFYNPTLYTIYTIYTIYTCCLTIGMFINCHANRSILLVFTLKLYVYSRDMLASLMLFHSKRFLRNSYIQVQYSVGCVYYIVQYSLYYHVYTYSSLLYYVYSVYTIHVQYFTMYTILYIWHIYTTQHYIQYIVVNVH